MAMDERLIVSGFILLLLGASLLVLVVEFATAYIALVGVIYALIAVGLVWRVMTKG